MAKVTKRYEEKEVVVVERTVVVTLKLSEEEANALARMIGNTISGNALSGVYNALYDEGYRGNGFKVSVNHAGYFKLEKI
jgi:hypothetical protein